MKDSTTGPFYYPNNPFDLAAEWANSPDDQRHTLTLSGSYTAKWGVQLSGLFHYGSGQAYQVSVGANPFGNTVTADRVYPASLRVYNPATNDQASGINGV